MPTSVWIVIAFFAGALIGRYFEKIIGFLQYMRKDIERVQKEAQKSIGR